MVLSAPSGTGKSTLAHKLIENVDNLGFSVSYTTREKREGEEDGRDYHFIAPEQFQAMIDGGEFLEWAEVFGRRYGTGRRETLEILEKGRDLLLDIDVQGARQVRESGVDAAFVFLFPPDFETLKARLDDRGSESDEQLRRRLSMARSEGLDVKYYDYVVVNDDLETAVDELRSVLTAERLRVRRRMVETDRILSTFIEK